MATADGLIGPVRVRFGEVVGNMSPRDRTLLVGLVVVALVFVVGGAGWLAKGYLADLRSRVADRETTLSQVSGMGAEYESAAKDIARIEDELRKHSGQDLSSFMEKASQKIGIVDNLKGVREKSARAEGNLEEKVYSVDLDKVTLSQLTSFLYEVEATGYPLQVRSTRVKASGQPGSRVLTVAMEISAFHLVEDAAGGAAEATP